MKIQTTAALMVMATAGQCLAELPGLPAAAAPVTEPSAAAGDVHDVRGKETPRALTVVQSGPVRGSLFKPGAVAAAPVSADGQPVEGIRTAPVSFIAVQPTQPHRYRKNDIVTVIVQENSQSSTDGKGKSDKTQDFDLAIQQFVQLALSQSGLPTVGTVNNPSSLPEMKFKYQNNRETEGSQERQDTLTARLSAIVVDVKPNGTMVLEATKQIVVDREVQVFKLSGICRVEDIAPDNTLLSTQLANLSLSKQTKGEVRDSNKSGWLNRFIDKINPF